MKEHDTWNLVDLPEGKRPIGCKWIFKTKQDETGDVTKFRARLVAQGYSQVYGTDYDEVFAPVARQETFRVLLIIAGQKGMTVKHFDVKTAFLNGDLEDEIYMLQREGSAMYDRNNKLCRLNKCIYGLKQSARAWNTTIDTILQNYGFKNSETDSCLYTKFVDGDWVYLLIYVDDIIVASMYERNITDVEELLKKHFSISSLGNLRHYLGMQIERDEEGIFSVNLTTYIEKLIQRFGLQDAKPSDIPIDKGYFKNVSDQECLPNNKLYREAIGSLLYVATHTRPDISVAVSILSRKVSCPTQADWTEVKRIFRYLLGSRHLKLRLGTKDQFERSKGLQLFGYADADWAGDHSDRKSNSGFLFTLYGCGITWGSKKQDCVSLSSTEAEIIALSLCCQEALWLERLLQDFHLAETVRTEIFEDNQSCLKLLSSDKISSRTKHIDTKYFFAKDLHQKKTMKFSYCASADMIADMFTKPLSAFKLRKFRGEIGLS